MLACGACFACCAVSPLLSTAAKLRRVHRALDEQYQLLLLIRRSLHERHFSALVPVLNPLIASIDKCQATFSAWEEKEKRRLAGAGGGNANAGVKRNNAQANAVAKDISPAQSPIASDGEPEAKRARS